MPFLEQIFGPISSILGYGNYISIILLILYSMWGWLGIHSAAIAAHHFKKACNETSPSLETANFLFLTANSAILGLISIIILLFALLFYFRSLLNLWHTYRRDSNSTLSDREAEDIRNTYFRHLILEIMGTYAAIYFLNYLEHNVDKRKFVREKCDGNWLERIGRTSYFVHVIYECTEAVICYVFTYVGIAFCGLGLLQSFKNGRVRRKNLNCADFEESGGNNQNDSYVGSYNNPLLGSLN